MFQFQRDGTLGYRWNWQAQDKSDDDIQVSCLENSEGSPDRTHIAIAFSISAQVDKNQISDLVPIPHKIYEVSVPNPTRAWLRNPTQLESFRRAYIELIDRIERDHGKDIEIHIFAAVPAPIAIDVGRFVHPKVAPTFVIYDRVDGVQVHALTIPGNRISKVSMQPTY